jgi:hypothetical protein
MTNGTLRFVGAIAIAMLLTGCGSSDISGGTEQVEGEGGPRVESEAASEGAGTLLGEPLGDESGCDQFEFREEAQAAYLKGLPEGSVGDVDLVCPSLPTLPTAGTGDQTATEPSEPTAATGDAEDPYTAEHEVNITGARWAADGVTWTVTDLKIVDHQRFCSSFDEFDEPEACYDDLYGETESIIALDMKIRNRSGRDIEWHPDQSTLVIGNEQIEGELVGPGDLGGTIRAGTNRDGQAWWLAKTGHNKLFDQGKLRIVTSPPYDAKTYDDLNSGNEIDLEVTW